MNSWNPLLDYLMNIITLKGVIIFWVLYFFVIWISIIIWVIKDISNRTDKLLIQIFSIISVIIFGPFWIFLYLLIRPAKTLFEQFYWEVEENLSCLNEDIIEKIGKKNLHIDKCKKCKKEISLDFKYCPYCKTKIDILEYTDKKKKSKKKKSK